MHALSECTWTMSANESLVDDNVNTILYKSILTFPVQMIDNVVVGAQKKRNMFNKTVSVNRPNSVKTYAIFLFRISNKVSLYGIFFHFHMSFYMMITNYHSEWKCCHKGCNNIAINWIGFIWHILAFHRSNKIILIIYCAEEKKWKLSVYWVTEWFVMRI